MKMYASKFIINNFKFFVKRLYNYNNKEDTKNIHFWLDENRAINLLVMENPNVYPYNK